MNTKAKIGEIWLVAMPILLVKDDNSFDTAFQIRPFLIVDEGKGMLVLENPDYLGLKITTKKNNVKHVEEIRNWKELGLKEKSYIRIEIPERIEQSQLIRKIIEIFNIDIVNKLLEKEEIA